jgi:RNA recognition motif-containing protein
VAHKDERRDEKGELREEFKTQEPRAKKGGDKAEPAAEKTPSDTVLYVSNLPFEFTDDNLKAVFEKHNCKSARIARRRNERSKGFGFVEFENKADQTAALALDGHNVEERQISVKVSMVGAERNPDEKPEKKEKKKKAKAKKTEEKKEATGSSSTLYISNLPFDLTDELLGDLFKTKGHNPVSARIARRRDDRSKGFGFVEFASEADQKAALAAIDGATIGERVIAAKVALKDSETREAGNGNDNNAPKDGAKRKRNRKRGGDKDGEEKKPVERKEKKDSERLVYVSNLSFDVDDNALAKLFDELTIKSAHVAVRHNGKSKGFGFVEFASQADQQKALAKNGTELAGRTLVVEIAKEDANPAPADAAAPAEEKK